MLWRGCQQLLREAEIVLRLVMLERLELKEVRIAVQEGTGGVWDLALALKGHCGSRPT